ncbi:ABC transporter permease [Corynebacterium sp. S7]
MNNILLLLSWRNIRSNTMRLILSIVAVVLGTSFVAGGFMLSASLQKAFDDIIEGGYEGVDVVASSTMEAQIVRSEVVPNLQKLPEVAIAEPVDQQPIALLIDDSPVQSGGAGSWVLPFIPAEQRVSDSSGEILSGNPPTQPNHGLIDSNTAEEYGVEIGDKVVVVDRTGRHTITIDGIAQVEFDTGGWAGVQLPAEQYWQDFSVGDTAFQVNMKAAAGSTPDQVVEAVRAIYPQYEVKTGEQAAKDDSRETRQSLSFISYILAGFGLIALLVGAFIISNTFSMIVAQRTKDFALLRALGLSRRQLTTSVVLEALIIGLIGSALGIVVGIGLVAIIVWVLDQTSLGFPTSGVGVNVQSVVLPLLVGVLVTVWGAWAPARRAGSVRPVEAMRSGDQDAPQPLAARTLVGTAIFVAGAVATILAITMDWSTSTSAIVMGAGAVGLVLGWWLLSAWLVRGMFEHTPRSLNVVTTLAGTNLSRNPRRTASTAFALMIGVTLVTAVGILGASMKESVFGAIDENLRANAVVSTGTISNQEFPAGAVDDINALDEVEGTLTTVWAPVTVNGMGGSSDLQNSVSIVMEEDPRIALYMDISAGDISRIPHENGVGLRTSVAKDMGVSVGDTVEVVSPTHTEPVQVPVLATWDDGDAYTSVAVSPLTAKEVFPEEEMWTRQQVYVTFKDGTNTEQGIATLKDTVAPYAVLQVLDKYEFRDQGAAQINGLLAVVYGLLALSVIIAVLGIINTLALSIAERRREFGMLRAVGMQRAQVRAMIGLESMAIAVFGALSGLAVGLWLGYGFMQVLSDEGLDRILIPWGELGLVLVGAVVVGMIAAIIPARQAAKTHPLVAAS